MKSPIIFLILFFFSTNTILAQSKTIADSLIKFLQSEKSVNDSLLFEVNRKLAYYHPEPEKALHFAEKALKIAILKNNYFNKARALEMIGANNRLLGNKRAGFQASFMALALYDSLKEPYKQAFVHMQIGEHLTEDKSYSEAITQFELSLKLFDSLNIKSKKILVLINLGEAYRLDKKLKKAIDAFLNSLNLNRELKFGSIEGYAKGNLGLAYYELGSIDDATIHLIQAIEILTTFGDNASISVYQAALGLVHIKQGETEKGKKELKEALAMAKSENLKKQIRDISAMLSSYYSEKKQFRLAYEYQKQFQVYQDSLVNASNIRKIEQIKSNYELDKKAIEIDHLELQNDLSTTSLKQKEIELLFSVVAALFLLILFVLVYYAYRNKRRSNMELLDKNNIITQQVREKEMLQKEIHHRVKNNLQLIGSIMGLQSQSSANEELSAAMSISKSRVEAMTIIHQNLFAEDHKVQINLSEYLEKLVANLKSTYQDQIQSIELKSVALDVIADDAIPIGLIINEGVCNAVKYQKIQGMDVKIDFYKAEYGYVLQINDNGPGFSDDENSKVGFGTKLIQTLAKQLRAELSVESSTSGTLITLLLKNLSYSELSVIDYKETE